MGWTVLPAEFRKTRTARWLPGRFKSIDHHGLTSRPAATHCARRARTCSCYLCFSDVRAGTTPAARPPAMHLSTQKRIVVGNQPPEGEWGICVVISCSQRNARPDTKVLVPASLDLYRRWRRRRETTGGPRSYRKGASPRGTHFFLFNANVVTRGVDTE